MAMPECGVPADCRPPAPAHWVSCGSLPLAGVQPGPSALLPRCFGEVVVSVTDTSQLLDKIM